MFDNFVVRALEGPLNRAGEQLVARNIGPNQITLAGFAAGVLAAFAVSRGFYFIGAIFFAANRVADGLDGAVARLTVATDFGAYLDLVLDLVVFTAIAGSFAVANGSDAAAAVVLVSSFMGLTATSLAFATIGGRRGLASDAGSKGLRPSGLIESTETAVFLFIVLIWPQSFPVAGWIFSVLCWAAISQRIVEARATFERG